MLSTEQKTRPVRKGRTTLAVLLAMPALALAAPQHQATVRTDVQAAQMQGLEPKLEKGFSRKNKNTIYVDCSSPTAKVKSIASGLNLLGDVRPAVVLITGTCHENVSISGLDRITLQGNPTATIDGGSDPGLGAVVISDSESIELIGLTTSPMWSVTRNFRPLVSLQRT